LQRTGQGYPKKLKESKRLHQTAYTVLSTTQLKRKFAFMATTMDTSLLYQLPEKGRGTKDITEY
jgi:hypothetical protein